MPKLPTKGLPGSDNGRLLVRLNHKYRDGIKRYGIARIINNKNHKKLLVLILGHDAEDAIFMPYDIRTALGVPNAGDKLDFSIQKAGLWAKLSWYISSPDPAVSIPAWIAIIGIGLGVLGLLIGVVS